VYVEKQEEIQEEEAKLRAKVKRKENDPNDL
jgi:hypothetical protein